MPLTFKLKWIQEQNRQTRNFQLKNPKSLVIEGGVFRNTEKKTNCREYEKESEIKRRENKFTVKLIPFDISIYNIFIVY